MSKNVYGNLILSINDSGSGRGADSLAPVFCRRSGDPGAKKKTGARVATKWPPAGAFPGPERAVPWDKTKGQDGGIRETENAGDHAGRAAFP